MSRRSRSTAPAMPPENRPTQSTAAAQSRARHCSARGDRLLVPRADAVAASSPRSTPTRRGASSGPTSRSSTSSTCSAGALALAVEQRHAGGDLDGDRFGRGCVRRLLVLSTQDPLQGPAAAVHLFSSGVPLAIMVIPVYEIFARFGFLSISADGRLPIGDLAALRGLPDEELHRRGARSTSKRPRAWSAPAPSRSCASRSFPRAARHRGGGDLRLRQRLGIVHRPAHLDQLREPAARADCDLHLPHAAQDQSSATSRRTRWSFASRCSSSTPPPLGSSEKDSCLGGGVKG